jgi:ATP-dependent Clp protease ATP-binding subunit ClpA
MDTRVQNILALGQPGRETDRARNCIALAIECADELGNQEFDSCHLLSGLYREGKGIAFHVLKHFAVTQRQIDDTLRSRQTSTSDQFQINRDIKDVLNAAFAAAREMSHTYIGTEHLLIGATSENVGAAKMLIGFGLSLSDVQIEVYHWLGHRLG